MQLQNCLNKHLNIMDNVSNWQRNTDILIHHSNGRGNNNIEANRNRNNKTIE